MWVDYSALHGGGGDAFDNYVGRIRGNLPRNQGQWFDQPTPSQATGEQSHDIYGPNPFKGGEWPIGPLNTEGAMRSGEGMTHQQLGKPPSPKEIKQLQTALNDPSSRQRMVEAARDRGEHPDIIAFLEGDRSKFKQAMSPAGIIGLIALAGMAMIGIKQWASGTSKLSGKEDEGLMSGTYKTKPSDIPESWRK